MKIFKFKKQITLILSSLFVLIQISCNQISSGQQRKKFEFLYKLNNKVSLLREYTNSITYFNELEFYEKRMKMLYTEVNRVELIKDWGESRLLKEKFLETIDDNLHSINTLKQKQVSPKENIRMEYDVIVMNERVDNYMKDLDDEISKVGKE